MANIVIKDENPLEISNDMITNSMKGIYVDFEYLIGKKVIPNDITPIYHFYDSFGHNETENSAKWLLRLATENGSWKPFTKDDITILYQKQFSGKNFKFNRLVESFSYLGEDNVPYGRYIIEKDDLYYFTSEFVIRLYLSYLSCIKGD
jgi:hypothetical protein